MKVTVKEKIKQHFLTTNDWISTRQLRQMFGEAGDRRARELRAEGLPLEFKRSRKPDGSIGHTYYWRVKREDQGTLF